MCAFRFDRRFYVPGNPVTCIGRGAYGSKAQGLVTMHSILGQSFKPADFGGITIDVPTLTILCTDVFDAFMQQNDLYDLANSNLPDDRIAYAFQRADLPFEILGDLNALAADVQSPLAVRSSSMLEDTIHAPFAGVYATKMIPNNQYDPDARFRQLAEAIKFVYASTYCKVAKDYRRAVGRSAGEEKMAVIIQEVVGKRHDERFYPEVSGVARSYNYYPVKPARPENGVVNLALGLGKTIVDGSMTWAYSMAYPKVEPPFNSVEKLLEETQTEFWAVNMGDAPAYDPIKETEYLLRGNLMNADKDGTLRYIASTYNPQSGRLHIGTGIRGPRALNFAPLLVLNDPPLNDLLVSLLEVCEQALSDPVEIEFAMTFNPHRFGFLQVRPMTIAKGGAPLSEADLKGDNILASSTTVLGNGVISDIQDIVYVKPECFEMRHTPDIAQELEKLNDRLAGESRSYLLVVLGRLGTSDPWLGIPVRWAQISGARVVIEATQENVKVELSQGSHYFHNIISRGVKYFSHSYRDPYPLDWDWLNAQNLVEETTFLRHVRLTSPLKILVDGRSGRGVIYKP